MWTTGSLGLSKPLLGLGFANEAETAWAGRFRYRLSPGSQPPGAPENDRQPRPAVRDLSSSQSKKDFGQWANIEGHVRIGHLPVGLLQHVHHSEVFGEARRRLVGLAGHGSRLVHRASGGLGGLKALRRRRKGALAWSSNAFAWTCGAWRMAHAVAVPRPGSGLRRRAAPRSSSCRWPSERCGMGPLSSRASKKVRPRTFCIWNRGGGALAATRLKSAAVWQHIKGIQRGSAPCLRSEGPAHAEPQSASLNPASVSEVSVPGRCNRVSPLRA